MFCAEGGRHSWPHVTDHFLGLDRNLLVAEQVGLHLSRVLQNEEGGLRKKNKKTSYRLKRILNFCLAYLHVITVGLPDVLVRVCLLIVVVHGLARRRGSAET